VILPDVTVLRYAFRGDSVDHARYRGWLDGVVNGDEAYGMSPQVLCSVTRIATHPRIYVS
jgi:predicted nucleic acid-binding protein